MYTKHQVDGSLAKSSNQVSLEYKSISFADRPVCSVGAFCLQTAYVVSLHVCGGTLNTLS